MERMKLTDIYAHLDDLLVQTQRLYEDTIEAYGLANDEYSQRFLEYRQAKAAATIKARKDYPVTLCVDIVQGETAELKAELIKAEGEKRKLEKLIEAYNSRLNIFKYIGKMTGKVAG